MLHTDRATQMQLRLADCIVLQSEAMRHIRAADERQRQLRRLLAAVVHRVKDDSVVLHDVETQIADSLVIEIERGDRTQTVTVRRRDDGGPVQAGTKMASGAPPSPDIDTQRWSGMEESRQATRPSGGGDGPHGGGADDGQTGGDAS